MEDKLTFYASEVGKGQYFRNRLARLVFGDDDVFATVDVFSSTRQMFEEK